MRHTANDVSARAGALIGAWRQRNLAAFEGELSGSGPRRPAGSVSSFEAEREELLEGIAFQMRDAARNPKANRPAPAAEVAACLGLLKHLASR